jgi:hypothetical protein
VDNTARERQRYAGCSIITTSISSMALGACYRGIKYALFAYNFLFLVSEYTFKQRETKRIRLYCSYRTDRKCGK